MPNKPLYRALIIGAIVLLIAGIWYFARKATWIALIKKKYPDGIAKDWTVENASTLWSLTELIGMYFNGHAGLEAPTPAPTPDASDSDVRRMKRGAGTPREQNNGCDIDILKGP